MERPDNDTLERIEQDRDSHPERRMGQSALPTLQSNPGSAPAPRPVIIAATFTADLLARPLKFWMDVLGNSGDVRIAPYAQVMQELLSPRGLLAQNKTGFNVLLFRLEDWIRDRKEESVDSNIDHVRKVATDFVAAIGVLKSRTNAPLLVFIGPRSSSLPAEYENPLATIQSDLMMGLRDLPYVHCWTHEALVRLYPTAGYEDVRTDRIAHIPYTEEYFAAIATLLARRVAALSKAQYKVIAIDCDNTLWKGICGEDGVMGVQFTPAHMQLQRALVRQHDAGMLLCLCSKNNPADVDAVFRTRPEMELREEHLVCSRVNWNAKSFNLQSIAEELNLSLDSFIFVDDSALECAEVKENCPAVLTLQLPDTAEEIARFVDHVWAFDRIGVTEEGKRRTAQYRQNRSRAIALEEAGDLRKFLASLELSVEMASMQRTQLARVAELIQRTNQFNLTALRRTSGELEALVASGDIEIFVVTVRDRFGDYGLVGALLLRRSPNLLHLDTFVLSCRVLGRGVEHRIVNELARIAEREGRSHIVLQYTRTARNAPAWTFLQNSFLAFRSDSDEGGIGPATTIFTVPAEYAKTLGTQPSELHTVDDNADSRSSTSQVPSIDHTQWHEIAYRLRCPSDVLREISRSLPIRQEMQGEYVAPQSPMEEAVAAIWADVLGLGRVSARADFFDLGGDSLLAVQAISRVGSVLGLELPLHEFFEEATVENVAASLARAVEPALVIQRASREGSLPLSWAQRRLWFIDQLEGASAAYHICLSARLSGSLNRNALQDALDSLLERHEALRTIFIEKDGEVVQQVESSARFALLTVDLSVHAAQTDSEVRRQADEEVAAPFDLSNGPLIRGRLLRLSEEEHLLLLTMHHIISDGWSVGVMVREIGALYGAYRKGEPNPLPPLPIQYADHVHWQRQWLSGAELERQLTHWTNHLRGAPEILELPADRPRPPVQSYRGASVPVTLEAGLTGELKSLSRRLSLTLAMTLYAAWSILLARLSGQGDIVVGLPVANRRRTELEGLIGLFVNTVAVRVRLDDDPPVEELLQQVKRSMLGAYANQDAPFERVVEVLQPGRSLSHSPIYQVLFVLQNAPRGAMQLPGLTLVEEDVPLQTAQFDLTLSLQEATNGIFGCLNYASDLFDGTTIKRWVGCLTAVLNGMVQQPQQKVSAVPMLSAGELARVVRSFNVTQAAYPQEKLIHELFEKCVEQAPDAIAVVCGDRKLSYAQLNDQANQVAHELRGRGVLPDARIALYIDRGVDMVVGLLGILKAGGGYVPLDVNYPIERITYMLRDSAPVLVLTQARLGKNLAVDGPRMLMLDADADLINRQPCHNPDPTTIGLRSRHLAYVIYTSGSTGAPKGVMVEHHSVVNLIYWHCAAFGLSADRCSSCVAAVGFDAASWEILPPLAVGATLVIASAELIGDTEAFLSWWANEPLDISFLPTPMAELAFSRNILNPTLRTLLVGGDRLSHHPGPQRFSLINNYGPTESTVVATSGRICDGEEVLHIGRPISNTRIYILDRHLQPLPIGVSGELYIGGVGVARGYLNRPELEAQRFLSDPFSSEPHARMYRTGDLARWRLDGTIEFLGRNDEQVKIRGYRIELGEIETQLRQHERVRDVAVVTYKHAIGEKRLVAYVTPRDARSLDVETLRSYLKAALPEYMIPSAFVIVDSLPLTAHGKLDRRALPTPDSGAYAGRSYEGPEGETEKILAAIWQELLQVERIGRRDNFFDLGGHSLLALKSLFNINQSFGCGLRVTDIYKNPTVCDLALRISAGVSEEEFVDLAREATLDEDIVAKPGLYCTHSKAVMLTGGTGFVGRFLLAQLLQDTHTTVYCLVRAKSERQAYLRLRDTLSRWDLWRDEFAGRIVAVSGDLRLPRLGIDADTYQMLCRTIDSIYHCATSMNHLETYAMAKPANVDAARELLRLATHHKPKLINYISTLGVFSASTTDPDRVVNEATPIDHEKHLSSNGYVASKWVGEKLFMGASARGIRCNIFRLGFIWADTEQGRYDELQHGYRMLKSCLLSGYGIENYQYEMPPTPVDYAVRAVVFLADRHREGQGIFHISTAPGPKVDGIFERCNEIGEASLELLPAYRWIAEMKRFHHEGRSMPATPLIEYAFTMDEASFREHEHRARLAHVSFVCSRTHRELESAGIIAPMLSDDLLRRCLRSMFSRDEDLRIATMRPEYAVTGASYVAARDSLNALGN